MILLISRCLTSYKDAIWRIYYNLQYNIEVLDIAYRHIISKNHQISIPKSNFFQGSILDHFLITFGRQNDSNWPPNRSKSEHFRVRHSGFSWFVCRPCSKTVQNRLRSQNFGQTVTSLNSKSDPLGSKIASFDSKVDPLASKSEPLLCKSYLQL